VLCACSVFRSWRKNIKDNNEKIKVFEQTIALLEIKKEEIQEQRDKEKEMLESQLSSVMSERQSHTPSIRETDVFLLIQNYVNHNKGLKNEHWNTLSTEINKLYPNFESILLGKYGISETEYRVCLLIKAGFSPKEMGILTNSSIKTISSIRKRLLKKTFNVDETPAQWDKFIKSL
jgi:DNA-binding NarL/FixJ family response regulator